MRNILAILLSVFFSSTVFGTVQFPDNIIYNGEEYVSPCIYPMESYFEKYPDKRLNDSKIMSTAFWGGYVATFEIKKIKADLQKEGSSDEDVNSFLRSSVIRYTSKILVE